MKTLSLEALTHLAQECTTTAICWLVELKDGTKIRGTDHDKDIEVGIINSPDDELEIGGHYYARANISGSNMRSAADMSVDNMEVQGASGEPGGVDLTVAQHESGVADMAPVTIFLVNWEDPDSFQIELRRGYMGELKRDSDAQYITEARGMTQPLTQNIGQTYGTDCSAVFGDARCKYPVDTITRDGELTAVTSRRLMVVDPTPATAPTWPSQFYGGEARFLTGPNAGFKREIKRADFAAGLFTVEFWDPLPVTPTIGDTLDLVPGCDKTKSTCKLYDNVINMRAYGLNIPGMAALMRGPDVKTPTSSGGGK